MEVKIRKPFLGDYPITQKFGEALAWYVEKVGYPHNGIDFAMKEGTLILACDAGKVCYADNIPDTNGLVINVLHSWGLSQYWHLSKLSAIFGQEVKRGDTLGYSGSTGFATGPHLHFGIKVNGVDVPGMRGWANPADFFDESVVDPSPSPIVPRTYLVRPGDTLWRISENFYGNGIYWRKIFDANKSLIKDPNKIYPFWVLRIP